MLSSWLYKSISSSEHWKQNAVAVVGVLCVCVPVIVLCQSESLLMQGSSCYCDSLSHSRSGRTISALPAALSWSLHNMHIHTRQRVREPLPQSCWGDKKWRGVCVWESLSVCVGLDGRGVCVCVCNGSALSSLHSTVLIEGYVKRQTCCCSLQQRQ